jgi:hypothetical protein
VPGTTGRCGDHRAARVDLVAEQDDGLWVGADEGDAGVGAGFGELRPLAQEAVARVYGVDAGALRHLNDLLVVEVALQRRSLADVVRLIRVPHVKHVAVDRRVHRHGGDAHFAARAHDAERYLSAVGDQDLLEHECLPCCFVALAERQLTSMNARIRVWPGGGDSRADKALLITERGLGVAARVRLAYAGQRLLTTTSMPPVAFCTST